MEAIACWVVALRPEAAPLISRMGLKSIRTPGELFPIYRSKDERTFLTISGIGRVNSGAATAYLAGCLPDGAVAGWINFGIAGSGEPQYGETFLALKVVEEAGRRAWFPGSIVPIPAGIRRVEVTTVDRASDAYPPRGIVEMEASGFFQTAVRSSTVEFCQVAKVISDDPGHPVEGIGKEMVSGLCEASHVRLEPWIAAFRTLLEEEAAIISDPPGFSEWVKQFRFSESERFQLRRLLQRWQSLNPPSELLPDSFLVKLTSAEASLAAIRVKVRESSRRIL